MKRLFIIVLASLFANFSQAQLIIRSDTVAYPELPEYPFSYSKYGLTINEPYRWLKRESAEDTLKDWLEEQRDLAERYLESNRALNRIENGISHYGSYNSLILRKIGPYYFRLLRYMSGAKSASIFKRSSYDGRDELVFDIDKISSKDKIRVDEMQISGDHEKLAFSYQRNSRESSEIRVVNLRTGKLYDDVIEGYRYPDLVSQRSGFGWKGDGFYYTKYGSVEHLAPIDLGTYEFKMPTESESLHYVYYHKLGTPQSEDKLIFRRSGDVSVRLNVMTTTDERFLVIMEKNMNNKFINVFVDDFQDDSDGIRVALSKVKGYFKVLGNADNRLLVMIGAEQDDYWLGYLDPTRPNEFVPALNIDDSGAFLKSAYIRGDRIITIFDLDAKEVMLVFDLDGTYRRRMAVEDGSAFTQIMGDPSDSEVLIKIESTTKPPLYGVYDLDLEKFVWKIQVDEIRFDPEDYRFERKMFKSHDGVEVPLLIYSNKKKFNPRGVNPTLLDVYGGYGISNDPGLDPSIIYHLENGGVYAVALVRGGGDLGANWHKQGSGRKKSNSVLDFIGAAEYLIDNHYTTAEYLATTGHSHGGFVVSAAMALRPELFSVVIPVAGLHNLLNSRFVDDEYGNVSDSASFHMRHQLSSYHQIEDREYPSTLLITSGKDERVDPFNSITLAAKMQQHNQAEKPVLLLVTGKGHGVAYSWSSWVQLRARMLGFMYQEMGIRPSWP